MAPLLAFAPYTYNYHDISQTVIGQMDELETRIKAAQDGDTDAFNEIIQHHYDLIFRFALKWSANREDAEDITQQACIKLAQNIEKFEFKAAFSSWLYRLVVNSAKDWQKSQKKHTESRNCSEELAESAKDSSNREEACIYLEQLIKWADSLGEGFKETLILVFAEGLSHAEAGNILKIKESTVSWRIHTIRSRLDEFDFREA